MNYTQEKTKETQISADVAQHAPSKHQIIVVDSNILIQSYAFNSHPMQNLLDFAQKTDSYVYIYSQNSYRRSKCVY